MPRLKLKVDNATHWSTRDLRKLIERGIRAADPDATHYRVDVRYGRRSGDVGGWGYYHRRHAMIAPPKHVGGALDDGGRLADELPPRIVKHMAQVLVHEIGHNQGLKHGEMSDEVRDWWKLDVPWADGLRVRRQADRKVTRSERVDQRAAHVDRKVAEIEGKLAKLKTNEKRLRTRLREWKRKQRYYEKRAAAGRS